MLNNYINQYLYTYYTYKNYGYYLIYKNYLYIVQYLNLNVFFKKS